MKKILTNKGLLLLIFTALFGFSVGLFDNFRELWLANQGLEPLSISRIISLSSIITVLVLLFFTIRVPKHILEYGLTITLILKMLTSSILIVLNNTNHLFLIKFLMFFDIAFIQVILSSIYPLMLRIDASDELYTKKDVAESLSSKLGILLATILLGKTFCYILVDYNTCLLLSNIVTFLSFLVLINLNLRKEKTTKPLNIKNTYNYFKNNKIFILNLMHSIIGGIVWNSLIGMIMLTLTKNLNLSPNTSSFIILIVGLISNFLALFIIKFMHFKNDHIGHFVKFGFRIILYLLVFITGSKPLFLITLIYLLLTDKTYNYIFSGYFINHIKSEYSLIYMILSYASSLIGYAIGVIICGRVFDLAYKYLVLPALIISIIHYLLGTYIIFKRTKTIESQ